MPIERTPPRTPHYVRKPPSLRLYMHDLDALIAFLRQRCASATVRVGDQALIQAATELVETTGRERRKVLIKTESPQITIRLSHDSIVETWEDSAEAKDLVDETYKLLVAWRSRWTAVRPLNAALAVLVSGVGSLFAAVVLDEKMTIKIFAISWVVSSFAIFLWATLDNPHRCVVVDRTRRDARDRTVLVATHLTNTLVSAVVGSLITFALTK